MSTVPPQGNVWILKLRLSAARDGPGRQPRPCLRLRSLHPPMEGVHCCRFRVCLLSLIASLVDVAGWCRRRRLESLFFSRLLDGVRCAGQAGIDQTVARFRDRHVPLRRALIQRLRRRREQPQLHPHSLQAWRLARSHGNVPTLYRFISGKITAESSKQRQCRVRRVGCLGNRMFTAGGNSLRRTAIYRSTNGGAWHTAMLGNATSSNRHHPKCATHHTRVGHLRSATSAFRVNPI